MNAPASVFVALTRRTTRIYGLRGSHIPTRHYAQVLVTCSKRMLARKLEMIDSLELAFQKP